MYSFNVGQFIVFMSSQFDINVDEKQVGEDSVLLYKEEIDKSLISETMFSIVSEIVIVQSYVYDNEEYEWLVCVASDANTNQPLFLLCLKNGLKVYEEILIGGNDSGNDSKETF